MPLWFIHCSYSFTFIPCIVPVHEENQTSAVTKHNLGALPHSLRNGLNQTIIPSQTCTISIIRNSDCMNWFSVHTMKSIESTPIHSIKLFKFMAAACITLISASLSTKALLLIKTDYKEEIQCAVQYLLHCLRRIRKPYIIISTQLGIEIYRHFFSLAVMYIWQKWRIERQGALSKRYEKSYTHEYRSSVGVDRLQRITGTL